MGALSSAENEAVKGRIVRYDMAGEIKHGIYVSRLVGALCRALGIPEEEAYGYRYAGFLHDIGKLRLVSYLYGEERREAPMVVEEMQYVRMHSRLSCEILKEKGFPEEMQEAVLHHHENYNGTGYPDALSGEEIPFASRLIRVCDVYAALTSDRPYRKRFSKADAVQLMIDEAENFDMRIFLAFSEVVHGEEISLDDEEVTAAVDAIVRTEIERVSALKALEITEDDEDGNG